MDKILQGGHVGSHVDEEITALLFNFKMMAFLLPNHAQDIEFEFLAAVSDQKRAILIARLLHHDQSCLPVNIGMIPLC